MDFAAIREKLNTSPKSDSAEHTPLSCFLHIYNKARKDCYVDYMEGAKILADWLSPISLVVEIDSRIPDLFRTYELTQLAKIIHPNNTNFAEDAIFLQQSIEYRGIRNTSNE